MSLREPVYRNRDMHDELQRQLLGIRDWIRKNLPSPGEGYVVEDLDLVLRVYSPRFGTDEAGKFMLIELKYGMADTGYSQRRTFGLINHLLRQADPNGYRYLGYFIVNYDDPDWDKAHFKINRQPVTREDFLRFLRFENGQPS